MSREAPFGATKKDVESFNSFGLSQEQKQGALEALGGLGGLCESLKTDDRAGLSDAEAASGARIAWFGANRMPAPEEETWWELFVAAFDDATVIVLCVAAAVSLAVGLYDDPAKGWIEGAAILAAVLVVAVVTATNDYQKQIQFRALNAAKDDVPVKVVRGGRGAALSTLDLVVGDLVRLLLERPALPRDPEIPSNRLTTSRRRPGGARRSTRRDSAAAWASPRGRRRRRGRRRTWPEPARPSA